MLSAFPAEIARYWDEEKNKNNTFQLNTLTTGSAKRVFFKCARGHHWRARVCGAVAAWKRGNSGCASCHGDRLMLPEDTTLKSNYPNFVNDLDDAEKNSADQIDLGSLTFGSRRAAHFKCPVDGIR